MAGSRPALARILALALGALAAAAAPSDAKSGGRVYASATEVEPLAPGASVPPVQVSTVRGEPIDLAERVRERGALLVFYRGGW